MKFPSFLPAGGTIGFVAPSFGCATEPYYSAFLNAQKKWKEMGYLIDPGPNCYAAGGIGISNSPKECAKELSDYYQKPDNDCLISCGGGELMCEILEYLDFEKLSMANPKWYMGYSDNTNFTYLLTTLCDTASIYGPCAAAFGMEPWHPSLADAFGILQGKTDGSAADVPGFVHDGAAGSSDSVHGGAAGSSDSVHGGAAGSLAASSFTVHGYGFWEQESLKTEENPLAPYHVTEPSAYKKFPDEPLSFSGRLLGGCMDCLVNLLGTRFDRTTEFCEKYKDDGILWFLESCDLNVFAIRRAMWQMENAGWFSHVKGFLIGRPAVFGQEMMGLDAYRAVLEVAQRHNVPVIMDLDIGHLPPMMPIICGSLGYVTSSGNDFTLRMELK